MSKSKGACVSAEEMAVDSVAGVLTKENAPLEQTYRADAESIRSQIEKINNSIATLEGVIADEGRSASERKAAETAARGRQANTRGSRAALGKAREVGRQRARPAKWIEPVPTLTTVKQ